MSNPSDLATEAEHKRRIIMGEMPYLMDLWGTLGNAGLQPSAVVLPADWNPGPYDGPDAPDREAQMMGLPIVWADHVGLLVEPDRAPRGVRAMLDFIAREGGE